MIHGNHLTVTDGVWGRGSRDHQNQRGVLQGCWVINFTITIMSTPRRVRDEMTHLKTNQSWSWNNQNLKLIFESDITS